MHKPPQASESAPGRVSIPGRGGARQKPWVLEGIGQTHFPITASSVEVQKWFDQGNTLLHSYWFYEAERAFRWSVKLDPECAMCYWGMARSTSGALQKALIVEAAKRKDKVTPHERSYIEAWEQRWVRDDGTSEESKQQRFEDALQQICIKYPDDLEAKLLFSNERLGSKDAYGIDAILRSVLAVAPRHPGALHYRIHLWDKKEPEYILSNSTLYGSIATSAGHGQHMVGHIFSGVGMWQEAAISMDTSNRIELRYMREHMALPFNNWNYAHNRDYLSFVQEQLGMYDAAVAGARELLAAPLDPRYNDLASTSGAHWMGLVDLVRAHVKFERWDAILKPGAVPWGSTVRDNMLKHYCETLAWMGLGVLDKAEKSMTAHAALKQQVEKPENKDFSTEYATQSAELKARMTLFSGNTLEGLALLTEAAKRDFEYRKSTEGLGRGTVLYNVLGEAYLTLHSPELAASAFGKTLEVVRNDGFALSGLVNAYAAAGKTAEARRALGRLMFVWSDADRGLKWMESVKQWKLNVQPLDESPVTQRKYKSVDLQAFGPSTWDPYASPLLDATDVDGKKVTFDRFRGKNILLIFYPAGECPQCVAQLVELGKRRNAFLQSDVEFVVVSGDSPAQITALAKASDPHIQLLWDPNFEDTRRFHAYDDFEDMPLNSINMIDKYGKVHWFRTGGDPFTDYDFLLKEVQRMNDATVKAN